MKKKPKLSKKWRGAEVVRGLSMHYEKLDALVETHALVEWDATRPLYVVVADLCLDDHSDVRAFIDRDKALRYARACANGNVDQRVLRVTEQVLVVATDNDL